MATITASAYNDAAARSAGEAMTINNGAVWTVRTDGRVHANAPASNTGSLGSVTINEGELVWDSRNIRWMPFNSGTGNVPAIGTTITQGAVSGYFLGVWASKTVAVTAVGAAMPTSGFIKFREVTGGNFAAGALTGIGASATGPDVQGWISHVYDAAANFTIPRLGKHTARGGRFFLENTNGSVGQIFQVPTEGSSAMYAPGLWIETGVGTDVYEYWPGLYSSTNGWSHLNIGEAEGQSDARQKFLKILAGGQLQMGETYTQASTYASLAAQAGTYTEITHLATYTWENDKITVYFSSGHFLEEGQQTGLDFTSGSGVDGIYTVLEVLSPYYFTVSAAGSGTGGNVTIRPGVTVTFTSHGLNIGESVYCDFTSGTGVDGTYEVYAVPTTSTYRLKYPHTAALTAGNVSCIHTLVITFTAHGMAIGNKVYLDFTSGTGVDGVYTIKAVATNTYNVNFAHSATTSGNVTMMRQIGYVAPSGLRTWIPSNILNECATGARATNTVPNTTIASRPEWITTSAGAIDLEYVYGCSGYPSFSQPYSFKAKYCAFFDQISLSECATPVDIDNVHTSMQGALDIVTFAISYVKGTIKNGRFERGNTPGSNDHSTTISNCIGLVCENIQTGIIQFVRSSGSAFSVAMCAGLELNYCRAINGPINLTSTFGLKIKNFDYCDRYTGRTNATSTSYAFYSPSGCTDILIDGLTFGFGGTIEDCHPLTAAFYYGGMSRLKIRNVGSIYNRVVSGVWAKNLYGMQYGMTTAGGNSDVKIQKVFFTCMRTASFTSNNSDRNMLYEHVMCGIYTWATKVIFAAGRGDLDSNLRGLEELNYSTGQASVYGLHYVDMFEGKAYGRITLFMNEPTTKTANQFTMVSGVSKYNSSGGILMGVIGDQAIWEDDVFRKGHTGFVNTAPVMAGGTITNYTLEYQIDVGSGYSGSWSTLNGTNLSAISIDPAVGFKIKIRITTTTTNTTAITSLTVLTTTSLAAQNNYYPLDTNTLTLTNLPSGVEVRIRQGSKTLAQSQSVTGGVFSFDHALAGKTIKAQMTLPGYSFEDIVCTLTDSDVSLPVTYSPDPSYI
jgi:hypothetical protein